MGQKTNPIGNRLGIIRGWDSNWYGGRRFEQKLVEDNKIRKYLNARLAKAGISKIYIERTLKLLTVTINTARPGLIIGKAGSEVDKLKEELKKLTGKDVQINITEVKRPELFIDRAVTGLVAGQLYDGYKGAQIIMLCVYMMVRSSSYPSPSFCKSILFLSDSVYIAPHSIMLLIIQS